MGTHRTFDEDGNPLWDVTVWLRVTNETTYRAWNSRQNGVKRQSSGDGEGFFGAINLLGPRSVNQRPASQYWSDQYTMVQLRFDFLKESSTDSYSISGLAGLEPVTLERTYLTFYDLDTGEATTEGSGTQIEALQIGPQALTQETWPTTELQTYSSWSSLLPDGSQGFMQTIGTTNESVSLVT